MTNNESQEHTFIAAEFATNKQMDERQEDSI